MAFLAPCLFVLFGYIWFFSFWWKILWNVYFHLISLRLQSGLFSFSHLYVPLYLCNRRDFFLKMTNPKLNFFIKGGKNNQSVASMWYTFVVKTNNNSSYIVFEQTQTILIFKGNFYLFLWENIQKFKGNVSSYFFTNLESGNSLQSLYLKLKNYYGLDIS